MLRVNRRARLEVEMSEGRGGWGGGIFVHFFCQLLLSIVPSPGALHPQLPCGAIREGHLVRRQIQNNFALLCLLLRCLRRTHKTIR